MLFLLVAIFSQAFFALVRSHLMAFSFFSAGHCCEIIKGLDIKYCCDESVLDGRCFRRITKGWCSAVIASVDLFHVFHEHFCRLECGDLVFGDDDGCVL